MVITSRRGLLLGLGASLVAAPAIVRAASLMLVRAPKLVTARLSLEVDVDKLAAALKSEIERLIIEGTPDRAECGFLEHYFKITVS